MFNVRYLGLQPYTIVWDDMKRFTSERDETTVDELWLLEHSPVYTQGQAGKAEHVLNLQSIPIVQTDRGGQITYHGPGQLVAYLMMNIRRQHMGIRTLVCKLEQVLVLMLEGFNITAQTRCGAPGVYVGEKKIASVGLRVKNGCTYHGIALNVSMDLSPFSGINPCGYAQLLMTQMKEFIPEISMDEANKKFLQAFLTIFEH